MGRKEIGLFGRDLDRCLGTGTGRAVVIKVMNLRVP
jgi:hypothetical protein